MAELSSSAKRRQRARRTRSNLWETAVTNTPAQGCNTAPNNDAEMEIKALREQLAIAKEREVENTAARTHAEMEVKALKKELESAKGNVTEIITSLADAEKEIEALKKKVETAEERDAASRSAAEKEIGILKDQFAKVKRDAENGELASKERTRSLQCQLEETKRRMSELADENVRHISDVSRAEEETRRIMEDLQKTRAEAYEKITALQTQISQYDNQNVHDTRDSGFPGSTMSNRTVGSGGSENVGSQFLTRPRTSIHSDSATSAIMEDLDDSSDIALEKTKKLNSGMMHRRSQGRNDTNDSRNLDGLSTHSVPSTVCLGNAIGISSVSEGVPGRKNTTPSVDQIPSLQASQSTNATSDLRITVPAFRSSQSHIDLSPGDDGSGVSKRRKTARKDNDITHKRAEDFPMKKKTKASRDLNATATKCGDGRIGIRIQSGYKEGCNVRIVLYSSGRATSGVFFGTVFLPAKREVKVALGPEKTNQWLDRPPNCRGAPSLRVETDHDPRHWVIVAPPSNLMQPMQNSLNSDDK